MNIDLADRETRKMLLCQGITETQLSKLYARHKGFRVVNNALPYSLDIL